MGLKDELNNEVREIFSSRWGKRDATVVPSDDSLTMKNDGANLVGTVLYADLSESTSLVDTFSAEFAAEVYKAYLRCAAKIIRSKGGTITAYDGDRIMSVFIGNTKNSSAVEAALKINYAVSQIINPALSDQYGSNKYTVKQVVGIDTSKLLVAKAGVRGANDLVWVGRAANHAAKLCSMKAMPTYITEAVYKNLNEDAKFSGGVDMWEKRTWTDMGNATIYRSSYSWNL